jgi:aspartate carbamoyltransferase regulatory subunit
MNNKDKQVKNDKKLILDSKESSNLQIEMNTTTKSNKSKSILVIEDDEKIQNEVIIAPQLEINKIHNEDCITGMKKICQ